MWLRVFLIPLPGWLFCLIIFVGSLLFGFFSSRLHDQCGFELTPLGSSIASATDGASRAPLRNFKHLCFAPCPVEDTGRSKDFLTTWEGAQHLGPEVAVAARERGERREQPDPGAPPSQHPYPEARRSLTGFQAQMNTSDSWPRRTVALLGGISTSPSISIGFE